MLLDIIDTIENENFLRLGPVKETLALSYALNSSVVTVAYHITPDAVSSAPVINTRYRFDMPDIYFVVYKLIKSVPVVNVCTSPSTQTKNNWHNDQSQVRIIACRRSRWSQFLLIPLSLCFLLSQINSITPMTLSGYFGSPSTHYHRSWVHLSDCRAYR